MTLDQQSLTVFMLTWVLWFAVPAVLLIRGRSLLLAGLGMLVVCFLPLAWQVLFTDSDAPGFAILLLIMTPIPLILTIVGLCAALLRIGSHALDNDKSRRRESAE